MKKELDAAINAAKEAGEILRGNFNKTNPINLKGDKTWVTEIDKRSEKKIISIIKGSFPSHSINAEESGFTEGDSEYLWLIDPLDGTTNYATHIPFFSISLAVAKSENVILGVVYDPIHNNLYVAEKNKGARLNDATMKVSPTSKLQESMVGYTRSFSGKRRFVETFPSVELSTKTPKILGSTALQLCYVASGVLDVSISLFQSPWDIAAGSLIVEEADGKVTDLTGDQWSINSKDILATNGKVHKELLDVINS